MSDQNQDMSANPVKLSKAHKILKRAGYWRCNVIDDREQPFVIEFWTTVDVAQDLLIVQAWRDTRRGCDFYRLLRGGLNEVE
jgi:hypothetical protein